MPSPFPGIDPYIESQGFWPDFHGSTMAYIRDALNISMPDAYVAQIEEQLRLVAEDGEVLGAYRPDVALIRDPFAAGTGGVGAAVAEAVEPVTVPAASRDPEEVRETWVEILHLPERELVAVIELLSPSNKAGVGQDLYLDKRRRLHEGPAHLVEIDLLLGGRRRPMARPLPPGDAFAIVSRAERWPDCDVYAWSIRRAPPPIPIPLRRPDPDVPLDLAAIAASSYDRGRYGRLLDYGAALGLPMAPDDLDWARGTARAGRPTR